MRLAGALVAWAALASSVAAFVPGSPGYRVAKHQERKERDAREREAARQARAEARVTPRQYGSESKFLTSKTEAYAVNGTELPDLDFDIGESYSGLMPIGTSNDTDLFFWFFPSTNEAATNEIVPGCSSMSALLEENGPFTWLPGTYKPQLNPWSWHHLSNVIWVDQPVGTGYDIGTPTYHNETQVADQFRGFWKNFVDTFDLHGYEVYITGESYAGLYCPYVAGGMVDQHDTDYFNISGMLVYDGVLDWLRGPMGDIVSVPFIDHWAGLFPFNESFSESIHERYDSCGYRAYLDKFLTYPPPGLQQRSELPGINANQTEYLPGCGVVNDIYEAITDLNPCFNIYQVSAQCPIPYDPLGFSADTFYTPAGAPEVYFNRSEVKAALHVPADVDWAMCKDGVFPYGDNSDPSNVAQIPKVIEATNNVQIAHGTLDMVLFMNETLLAIQNMTWNGQLGFQERPTEPLFVPYHDTPDLGTAAGQGIFGTAHTERGLTYATISLSGHEVPGFQPGVAYRQLEVLLGRIPNLQSTLPFTTDTNNTAQPDEADLGAGTGGN